MTAPAAQRQQCTPLRMETVDKFLDLANAARRVLAARKGHLDPQWDDDGMDDLEDALKALGMTT